MTRGRRAAVALGLFLAGCVSTPSGVSPMPTPLGSLMPSPSTGEATAAEAPTWREVGSFGGAGSTEHALGVTFGAGQFVAVGIHYTGHLQDTGPVPHEGRVWLSPDGTSWEALPSMPAFEGATFSGVLTAQDGSVVAFGRVDVAGGPTLEFPGEPATWRSADGRTWEQTEVGPQGLFVTGAAHGAKGYLLVGSVPMEGAPSQLWLSADGLRWELAFVPTNFPWWHIRDIGAGDDGFTALLSGPGDSRITIASADGREWFEGDALPGSGPLAPLAGDWITSATAETLGSIPVWFSTNGLAWSEVASIADPGYGDGFGYARQLVSAGGSVFLGGARVTTASVAIPGGVWSSRDGRTWELTDIRPDGLVLAAAEHVGVVVLAGYVGVNEGRATFWIGAQE